MRVGRILCGLTGVLVIAGCGTTVPQPADRQEVYGSVPDLARAVAAATHGQVYSTIKLPLTGTNGTATVSYAEDRTGVAATAGKFSVPGGYDINVVRTDGVLYFRMVDPRADPATDPSGGKWSKFGSGP